MSNITLKKLGMGKGKVEIANRLEKSSLN